MRNVARILFAAVTVAGFVSVPSAHANGRTGCALTARTDASGAPTMIETVSSPHPFDSFQVYLEYPDRSYVETTIQTGGGTDDLVVSFPAAQTGTYQGFVAEADSATSVYSFIADCSLAV